jgi:16S rRNA (cytosine967-C5)-methyltransferase
MEKVNKHGKNYSKIFSARFGNREKDLQTLLGRIFSTGKPADRILAEYFRKSPKYGATDRRIISETLFSILRWWGFSKQIWNINVFYDTAAKEKSDRNNSYTGTDQDKTTRDIVFFSLMMDTRSDEELLARLGEQHGFSKIIIQKIRNNNDIIAKAYEIIALIQKFASSHKLSINNLIPEWTLSLIPDILKSQGKISFFQKRPPLWLRVKDIRAKSIIDEFKKNNIFPVPHPLIVNAFKIENARINLYSMNSFKNGFFELQDLASQSIGLVCEPLPGQRWWDACAGAGGKSLQLADIMKGKGTVVATDIREYKLEELKKRARRASLHNIRSEKWDGSAIRTSKQNIYDGVLVDAPCSCSGTWRRNPDAKWTSSEDEIPQLAKLQSQLLSNAASGLKEDGSIVYATCSIFTAENEDIVNNFIAKNPNFTLEPFKNPITGKMTNGTLRIYPWDGDCDAIFVAKFKKLRRNLNTAS